MHGELAELVALAAYGSSFLGRSADAEPPELFPEASVFRFTNAVEFRHRTRHLAVLPKEHVVGRACGPWYADLRRRGATAILLGRGDATPRNRELASYIEAGFSGGLDAAVVVQFGDGRRELWSGQWAVTEREHPEQRIWRVTFTGVSTRAALFEGPTLEAAAKRLRAALEAAASLAAGRPYFENWVRVFRDARALLESASPSVPYHPDLLPPEGYGLESWRLLAAASRAWVFGGMGSWNDVAMDDEPSYEPVTRELFDAVLDAVLAATNNRAESATSVHGPAA
jgi:hypothetical protein